MTLLSRQVYRTFFSPNTLTSAQRRWLRTIGITTNVMICIALLTSITLFIIVVNQGAADWFWENIFSRPWWPMPSTPK